MRFPSNFNSTFTVPTGAGPGTSRVVLNSLGQLISYGNPPVTSFAVFSALWRGGMFYGLQDGANQADFNNAGQFGLSVQGGKPTGIMLSPRTALLGTPAGFVLTPGDGTANSVNADFISYLNSIPENVRATGAFIKLLPDGFTSETWHVPVAATGWSIISLKYRFDGMDNVVYSGRIDYTGANVIAAGAQVATAAITDVTYRPKTPQGFPLMHLTNGNVQKNTNASVIINTDGTISIFWGDGVAGSAHDINGLATGDRFSFNCSAPLGNLP